MPVFQNEPSISVGILTEKQVNFDLYGDFRVTGQRKLFSGRFTADVFNDKIRCIRGDDTIEADKEIIFEPDDIDLESFLIKDVTIGIKFHWQRKEKQRFQGTLKLLKDNNKIVVINIIPVEKYLTSVISSEMSAKSSLQMLKSLAVVSRSWLLAQIDKSRSIKRKQGQYQSESRSGNELIKWYDREEHSLFDVCADDHCQRYQGITKINSRAARQAVEETAGLVLMYNNKICDARFSKSCGGITEDFHNVWEPVVHPYLTSIIDYKFEPETFKLNFTDERNVRKWILGKPPAFCNTNDDKILSQVLIDYDRETKDFYRWKIEYTQAELSDIILKKSGINFGDIIDLIPVERGHSSRLIKLKIVGTKNELIIGKELEIRRVLSLTHLYSSAIFIEKHQIEKNIPSKFIIYGAGWGHGVGLCQIGAAVMSENGHLFDEILFHYFKNVRLIRVY
ncbi:MAG TPA: SpoIID/LytB domain-containing protein [Ignavibacteriaceae bacterium]|nr:SpoIID/LytB domain-containing protein [Ignavibacteriaceae bacterium]